MKEVTERVFSHWINDVLKYNKDTFSKFKQVSIQDGSTVAVKSSLKHIWPCRFKKTCPAAIELHATLNLIKGSIDKASITPDTFSERTEVPELEDLQGHLFLADRGYYSADFVIQLDKAGGFYVLRAKGLKKVLIHRAIREDGKELINVKYPQLSILQKRLPKKQMVDMDVEIKGKMVRLIAIWSLKEKRHTYLISNLKRDEFSMRDISLIYRVRWQVELLFKECKSYNNLHGFNTGKKTLQESLVWASLISMTLKRFMTGCIEQLFKIEMSTMTVSKTTVSWWYGILEAIVQQRRKALVSKVTKACEFLKNNAQRAHPNRDKLTGIFQFGLEPVFYAKSNENKQVAT